MLKKKKRSTFSPESQVVTAILNRDLTEVTNQNPRAQSEPEKAGLPEVKSLDLLSSDHGSEPSRVGKHELYSVRRPGAASHDPWAPKV